MINNSMNKRFIYLTLLKFVGLTLLTAVLFWKIPYDAELGSLAYFSFILITIPVAGLILFFLECFKLKKLEETRHRRVLFFTSLLFLVVLPVNIGIPFSIFVREAERRYYSSERFVEKYRKKNGITAKILRKEAIFAQCSLISYTASFKLGTEFESAFFFDAENIDEVNGLQIQTGFVSNLRKVLDEKFKRVTNIGGPGIAYKVPAGVYEFVVNSEKPFILTISHNKKLFTTESLSGKDVYHKVLVDDISYQEFTNVTKDTKESTCKGTARKSGSYWFASKYVVIRGVSVNQDETGKLLYLAGYTPNIKLATIVTPEDAYTSEVEENTLEPYKTITNIYTKQSLPIFQLKKYKKIMGSTGNILNQIIEHKITFPEPLVFNDIKVYFEPQQFYRADHVIEVIETIEPAFYNSVSFLKEH